MPTASTTAAATASSRMLDVVRAKLLIHLEVSTKDAAEDLGEPLGRDAGARLLHRQMRLGQHRARGQRARVPRGSW